MTYRSRGRSVFELVIAVSCVAFLVGFIAVLCIGNYFRAKRAMEMQRQRRLAKHAASMNGSGNVGPLSENGYEDDWRQDDDDDDNQMHANERDRLLPGGRHPQQRRLVNQNSDNVYSQFANDHRTKGEDTMSV